MKIKVYKKVLLICILAIISLVFISCDMDGDESADDIKITVEIEDDYVENIQVYTVNGWKYIEDDCSVTVESSFKMKFIQAVDEEVRYYYFSALIATTEGTTFTIEDSDSDSDDTTVQVWRSSRNYAFTVDTTSLDYYKVTFGESITELGTVTYATPYIDVTKPLRVDYNEDQSPYLEYIVREAKTDEDDNENYFGNWDFSANSTADLNEYTNIEIYVAGTTYTVNENVLTKNELTTIELENLTEKN